MLTVVLAPAADVAEEAAEVVVLDAVTVALPALVVA